MSRKHCQTLRCALVFNANTISSGLTVMVMPIAEHGKVWVFLKKRLPVVPEHVSGLEELFHNFPSRSLFLTVIVLITHHNYALIFNIMSLIIKNFWYNRPKLYGAMINRSSCMSNFLISITLTIVDANSLLPKSAHSPYNTSSISAVKCSSENLTAHSSSVA